MTPPPRGRRLLLPLLVVAALLALVAGCSGDDGGAAAGEEPTTTTAPTDDAEPGGGDDPEEAAVEAEGLDADADLYEVPDPIPDVPHGTLLRYQEVTPSLVDAGRTWRVMYTSESVAGEPIVVTGQVIVPTTPAPEGGRTTLGLAHGTTGIADECAPSLGEGPNELALMGPVVEQGWIVTFTDYEGLGTPGRHPYLVGESEGRSVIDSVLAAGALPGADQGDQVALAGYSQGGHGALWAGEVAAEWAPDLEVVGTFAGAPATEVDVILRSAPRLPQAGFAYLIIAGIAEAYPEADLELMLTDEGVETLDVVDEGCVRDVIGAVAGTPASDLVRPDGPDSEPWAELASAQNPGQVVTDAPVLIVHSDEDETVPVALSGILEGRMCEEGQVVERRVLTDAGGHVPAAPEAYRQGIEWLVGLTEGEAPTDGCAGG